MTEWPTFLKMNGLAAACEIRLKDVPVLRNCFGRVWVNPRICLPTPLFTAFFNVYKARLAHVMCSVLTAMEGQFRNVITSLMLIRSRDFFSALLGRSWWCECWQRCQLVMAVPWIRRFTAEARVRSQMTVEIFIFFPRVLWLYPARSMSPVLLAYLHLRDDVTRTNERSLGTFQTARFIWKSGRTRCN